MLNDGIVGLGCREWVSGFAWNVCAAFNEVYGWTTCSDAETIYRDGGKVYLGLNCSVIANSFQVLVGFQYLLFNKALTCQLVAAELFHYLTQRNP